MRIIKRFTIQMLIVLAILAVSAQVSVYPNFLNFAWLVLLFAVSDYLFVEHAPDWVANLVFRNGVVTRVIESVRGYKSIFMHYAAACFVLYLGFPIKCPNLVIRIWNYYLGGKNILQLGERTFGRTSN